MVLRNILKYYFNNRFKFFAVSIAITLGVFLICFIESITFSINKTIYNIDIEPRTYFSMVTPRDKQLDKEFTSIIKEQNSVKETIPFVYWTTNFQMLIGGAASTDILQVKNSDIDTLMKIMGLKIKEGRKPAPGSHEIMLHWLIAANKNLKLGDSFGTQVNKDEWMVGTYKIVGLIEGPSLVSFAPFETFSKDTNMNYEYTHGAILLPRTEKLIELNQYLSTLPASYYVSNYNTSKKSYDANINNISLFGTIISLAVIIIISCCTGFLCYIYCYQRRAEFGLLLSLGYSRQQVINQAFGEISGMNIVGFIAGIILASVVLSILNVVIYIPRGQFLQILNLNSFVKALCVSVFSVLFSVIPVWRMLKTFDPISIIEGGV